MKTFKTLLLGLVAFGAAAIATPAQAYDWHHSHNWSHHHYYSGHYYYGGPHVYVTSRPYYYGYYDPYYYDYYGPPRAYYGPSFSIGFGGHGTWFHHH